MNTIIEHYTTGRVSEITEAQAVGNAIRAMREGCGLTATQLGAMVGMSPSWIGRIEHGAETHPREREAIATAIGHHLARGTLGQLSRAARSLDTTAGAIARQWDENGWPDAR